MVSVLNRAGVDFAILGSEETCTGDPRGAWATSISTR